MESPLPPLEGGGARRRGARRVFESPLPPFAKGEGLPDVGREAGLRIPPAPLFTPPAPSKGGKGEARSDAARGGDRWSPEGKPKLIFLRFLSKSIVFNTLLDENHSTFVQIYVFLPTFGRKSFNFCPNLWFLPTFGRKVLSLDCFVVPPRNDARRGLEREAGF